jgi:hypothetical protein
MTNLNERCLACAIARRTKGPVQKLTLNVIFEPCSASQVYFRQKTGNIYVPNVYVFYKSIHPFGDYVTKDTLTLISL